MSKLLAVLFVSFSIVGCSSNPYLDDYLDSLNVPAAYIYFEHPDYGLMDNQQVPLRAEFLRCNQLAFVPIPLRIGSYDISDVAFLERINRDYHAYLLESIMLTGSGEKKALRGLYVQTSGGGAEAELRRSAFGYTEGLEPPLKRLTRYVLKRNRCLAVLGWVNKRQGFR